MFGLRVEYFSYFFAFLSPIIDMADFFRWLNDSYWSLVPSSVHVASGSVTGRSITVFHLLMKPRLLEYSNHILPPQIMPEGHRQDANSF